MLAPSAARRCLSAVAGARGRALAAASVGRSRGIRTNVADMLDAWASGPTVLGHAHSRPSKEPYELSAVRELGGGAGIPEGWMSKLCSAAGLKSTETPNQDSYSYTYLDSGWIVCVACDGHGEHGDAISERVARLLPLHFAGSAEALGAGDALCKAFELAQAELERSMAEQQKLSGTMAAVYCFHVASGQAWVAHAGDSRVVLGDLRSGEVVFSTNEHKPHDPGEAERLQRSGAQVISRHYEDGELVSRIYVPGTGVPGLASSRSLGDGCLKGFGVVAAPDVRDVSALWRECAAPVAVLGSDGLWDFISPAETLAVLSARFTRALDVRRGAEVLLRRSQKLWIEAEGDYCDDVTVLLVAPSGSLAPPKPPAS